MKIELNFTEEDIAGIRALIKMAGAEDAIKGDLDSITNPDLVINLNEIAPAESLSQLKVTFALMALGLTQE